jgi:hypothetical protein
MMKNLFTNVSLLFFLTIGFVACTEEISEDVQNKEKLQSSSSTSTTDEDSLSMTLTSTVSDDYSHFLHEKDSEDVGCKLTVKDPENTDSSDYSFTDTDLNTDCILDAGEFDLFYLGAKLELSVDAGLCENVEYRPFKFFQYQPGNTRKVAYKVSCDTSCSASENAQIKAICDDQTVVYDDLGVVGTFNPDAGDTVAANLPFTNIITLDSDAHLCKFNYGVESATSTKPNCDEGEYTINTYTLTGYEEDSAVSTCDIPARITSTDCAATGTWSNPGGAGTCNIGARVTEADCTLAGVWTAVVTCGDVAGATAPTFSDPVEVITECAGENASCFAQNYDSSIESAMDGYLSSRLITHVKETEVFKKEYIVEAPYENDHNTNLSIANYSRVCSDIDTTDTITKNSAYYSAAPSFETAEIEEHNIDNPFSVVTIDEYEILAESPIKGRYNSKGKVFSDSPSLASSRYTTMPYYSFRCLDHAGDVKSQIRLFIREWDRSFIDETKSIFDFTMVSDIHIASPNKFMDTYNEDGPTNLWNDVADWDDFWNDQNATSANWIFQKNSCALLTNNPTVDYLCSNNAAETVEANCLLGGGSWNYTGKSGANFPKDSL